MKLRSFALLVAFAFVAGVSYAHGEKKHVSGTVEKINADSIVVKTVNGNSVEVKLVASTVVQLHQGKEDKPAKLSDLAVGDRVVIHATPKGNTLEADEIKFSSPGGTAAPSSAPKPKS